jgi:hypothetical protein
MMADLDLLHRQIALAKSTCQDVTLPVEEAESMEWWLWHLHRERERWLARFLDRPFARFVRSLPLSTGFKVKLGAL